MIILFFSMLLSYYIKNYKLMDFYARYIKIKRWIKQKNSDRKLTYLITLKKNKEGDNLIFMLGDKAIETNLKKSSFDPKKIMIEGCCYSTEKITFEEKKLDDDL